MKKYVSIFISVVTLVFSQVIRAQFTIVNSLKSSDATGLKIGDNAYLTAAKGVDPNGDGYLRLTEAKRNQKGYMYIMESFPTDMGFVTDFEYKAWRNVSDNNYFGADGFTVFFFDGSVSDADFHLGGYGGSLGYARYVTGTTVNNGLSGGYIGIGFDAYGNYIVPNSGRNGLVGANSTPNSIVLRGPTNEVTTTKSNEYFAHSALGDRSGTLDDVRNRNEIDYNTITSVRPSDEIFYRRVKVELIKEPSGYKAVIWWRKENESSFTQVFTYNINSSDYPLPATLKMGFAGSTGGGFNYQEVRSIILTTPGNLRVDSRTNTDFTCSEKKSPVVFNIEVNNDTSVNLSQIQFNSKITDSNNVTLTPGQFKITSITASGFTNSTIPSTSNTNEISSVVGLLANQSGTITITGEIYNKSVKTNGKFLNVSEVNSTEIEDIDPSNNKSITEIFARRCSVVSNPVLPSYNK